MTASAEGRFGAHPAPVRLELGEREDGVDIELGAGAAVEVVVNERLADACAGAVVEVVAEGMPAHTVATLGVEEAGVVRADGLPDRRLEGVLHCDGYSTMVSPPLHESGYRWEPMLPDGPSISGRVVDAEGSAVAGAGVWVEAAEQAGPSPSDHSDETGHFMVHGLRVGPATLHARATSSSPRASVEIVVEQQGVDDLVISLPASTEARGKIVANGEGVGAYRVEVSGPEGSCRTSSADTGEFACDLSVEQGSLDYRVEDHGGFVVAHKRAPVGEEVEIEVSSWTLTGMVRASEEGPYRVAAEVVVDGRRRPTPLGGLSDATGSFELAGLSSGASYWLTARSLSGNTAAAGPFFEGDVATLELDELARLEVLAPCPGELGELSISRRETSMFALLTVPVAVAPEGEVGTFDVPAGEWWVGFRAGAQARVLAPVTLEPGADQTVQFESCGEPAAP